MCCFSQLREPTPQLTVLSVLYSPLHSFAANIILPATYPFHVVSLLSGWTAPARLLSEPARCATLLQRLTNYKSSSKCHKEDFIEDKWKWAALVVTLNPTKARIERLATRDANDAWQGGPRYSVMWPMLYLIMSKILLTPLFSMNSTYWKSHSCSMHWINSECQLCIGDWCLQYIFWKRHPLSPPEDPIFFPTSSHAAFESRGSYFLWLYCLSNM